MSMYSVQPPHWESSWRKADVCGNPPPAARAPCPSLSALVWGGGGGMICRAALRPMSPYDLPFVTRLPWDTCRRNRRTWRRLEDVSISCWALSRRPDTERRGASPLRRNGSRAPNGSCTARVAPSKWHFTCRVWKQNLAVWIVFLTRRVQAVVRADAPRPATRWPWLRPDFAHRGAQPPSLTVAGRHRHSLALLRDADLSSEFVLVRVVYGPWGGLSGSASLRIVQNDWAYWRTRILEMCTASHNTSRTSPRTGAWFRRIPIAREIRKQMCSIW